jgi:drug/metabolite transporter (DMT)-like permease
MEYRSKGWSAAVLPPAAIAFAAMLWGTDALWRTQLIRALPATAIVFWEHVLLVLATGWLLVRDRRRLAALNGADWLAAVLVGVGASALATVLFTQAFRAGNPTTVVLLQKTQPLIAITLAAALLREPLPARFWPALPVALAGTYLISFGDASPLASIASSRAEPLSAALALGAAALWGAGTVLGRRLLATLPYPTVTALRFATALPALAVLVAIPALGGFAVPGPPELAPLGATVFLPGLLGLLLYYWGLRDTPASVSTLCELCFPITAIIVNAVFLGISVAPNQVAGIALLWGALAFMRHRPVPAAETRPAPLRTPAPAPVVAR